MNLAKLTMGDILKPGAEIFTGLVDMNDPEINRLFDESRKRQEEAERIKNLPFQNLTITI